MGGPTLEISGNPANGKRAVQLGGKNMPPAA